jgi:hypothetical protein
LKVFVENYSPTIACQAAVDRTAVANLTGFFPNRAPTNHPSLVAEVGESFMLSFFEAIKSNDLSKVKKMERKTHELVYLVDESGDSCMNMAAQLSYSALFNYLKNNGADSWDKGKVGHQSFAIK